MSNGNYRMKLQQLLAAGRIPTAAGAATYAEILHDTWCKKFQGIGECNCEPDIKLFDARTGKPLGSQ